MFSLKEKQMIAAKIEELLLSLDHPEMPDEMPSFTLHVKGKESWSWADIEPNWKYDRLNPPNVNPWNEVSRELMQMVDKLHKCLYCGKPTASDIPFCSQECNSNYEWENGENK